jgi:prepilin-type N-terminal cleavage/methylation domain-containing protein
MNGRPFCAGLHVRRRHERDCQKQDQGGFTLLEVLVSFAIAGLVVGIVLPAAFQARSRVVHAQEQLDATQAADAMIERIVAFGAIPGVDRKTHFDIQSRMVWTDDQTRARVRLAEITVTVIAKNASDKKLPALAHLSSKRLVRVPVITKADSASGNR